ncbi:MAG: peptidylprolyl isomerase, partial [Sphingomonadales bacterium]
MRIALALATALIFSQPVLAQARDAPAEPGFSADELPELALMGTVDPNMRKAQAIVNGEVITDTDVDQRLNLVVAANGGKISDEEMQRLRLQVMRNLIDEQLQLQEAASNDIRIAEADVQRSFDRIAQNFKRTPKQFEQYLRDNGSSPAAIKAQIRGEMAWSRVLRRKVEPFINVGDDEVQAIVDKLNAAKGKDEFHVGEIFLSATPENQEQVLTDAARIVGQIRGGASFVAYARQFSEASTASLGGDLGWVRTEQLNDAVAPAVTALTPGQVSDPIAVTGGVAIMALIEKRQVLSADPSLAVLSLKQ